MKQEHLWFIFDVTVLVYIHEEPGLQKAIDSSFVRSL